MFSSKTAICMVLATAATLACIAPTNALVHGRDDVDSVDVDSVRARRDVKAAKGAKAGKVISAKLAKAPNAPKAPKTTAAPDQEARDADMFAVAHPPPPRAAPLASAWGWVGGRFGHIRMFRSTMLPVEVAPHYGTTHFSAPCHGTNQMRCSVLRNISF